MMDRSKCVVSRSVIRDEMILDPGQRAGDKCVWRYDESVGEVAKRNAGCTFNSNETRTQMNAIHMRMCMKAAKVAGVHLQHRIRR